MFFTHAHFNLHGYFPVHTIFNHCFFFHWRSKKIIEIFEWNRKNENEKPNSPNAFFTWRFITFDLMNSAVVIAFWTNKKVWITFSTDWNKKVNIFEDKRWWADHGRANVSVEKLKLQIAERCKAMAPCFWQIHKQFLRFGACVLNRLSLKMPHYYIIFIGCQKKRNNSTFHCIVRTYRGTIIDRTV